MSSFLNAAVISIIYFLFRFFEMRVILKENKPLKQILRDSLVVYMSVLVANFFIDQLSPLAHGLTEQPTVFVDEPNF